MKTSLAIRRRDFLKGLAASLIPLTIIPVSAFVPPRDPFVRLGRTGLAGLVSQLGVTPTTDLSICEGNLLDIEGWDGIGYPCLVQNACTFGPNPPRVWIYDFDLWNFRDDDFLGSLWNLPEFEMFNSHAEFYAWRRFGGGVVDTVNAGGGWLKGRLPALRAASGLTIPSSLSPREGIRI